MTPVNARRSDDVCQVRRVRDGDQIPFQEVVERYQSRTFRAIYGILRNRAEAEEIAQAVFAKVYFSIHTFDGRTSMFTWIYRIAVDECYAYLRKRRMTQVYKRDSTGGGPTFDLPFTADGHSTAERAVAQRDFANQLLAGTPEEDRVLLLGSEVEGFSVIQLAEMTGLNESTVKLKLFHARRRLAELAARLSPPKG